MSHQCVHDHTNVSTTTPAFVFQMQCRSLEVVLWDSLANNSPMFLGEVVLDLNQTHFSDDVVWYRCALASWATRGSLSTWENTETSHDSKLVARLQWNERGYCGRICSGVLGDWAKAPIWLPPPPPVRDHRHATVHLCCLRRPSY